MPSIPSLLKLDKEIKEKGGADSTKTNGNNPIANSGKGWDKPINTDKPAAPKKPVEKTPAKKVEEQK